MVTVLEEHTHRVLQNTLPRIATALESIAKYLDNQQYPDIIESAMGPGDDDDDDLPF